MTVLHYSGNVRFVNLLSAQINVFVTWTVFFLNSRTTWDITMNIWDSKQNCIWNFFRCNQIFLKLLRICEWLVLILGLIYRPNIWHSKQLLCFSGWMNNLTLKFLKYVSLTRKDYQWRHFFPYFADIRKNWFLVCKLHRSQLDTMCRGRCTHAALEKKVYIQRVNVLELNWGQKKKLFI